MKLTNSQRVRKLLRAFLAQPQYILPYFLSNCSIVRRSPLEQNLPWWSFAAIREADRIFPGKRIFEWGSGGSTLRYALKGCSITAIEDDPDWLASVQKFLRKAEVLEFVSLRHVPFDFDHPEGFSESAYCLALQESDWDVVIIDGQDKTFRERITCFRHAEPLMRPGGIILLDDFWRYEEMAAITRARYFKVFESVGPCRVGVTSKAMFFY
jgi:hypothetical protein